MPGILERFERRRVLIAEDAGEQPGYGIDHNGCRQLAPAQNVISDRDFLVSEVLCHTFVDAFIPTADQQQFGLACQPVSHGLL